MERSLAGPPACVDELHGLGTDIEAMLVRDLGFAGQKPTNKKSLAWRRASIGSRFQCN
jgi:hypothetical protein